MVVGPAIGNLAVIYMFKKEYGREQANLENHVIFPFSIRDYMIWNNHALCRRKGDNAHID